MILTIRQAQWDALRYARREEFITDLAGQLRKIYPGTFKELPLEQCRQFVQDGFELAEDYGITQEEHLEIYVVDFMGRFGKRFDAYCDWARAILPLGLPPEQKIEGLQRGCIRAIEAQYGAEGVML
jgi:hypothetical protein